MRNAFLLLLILLPIAPGGWARASERESVRVPILCYHRFGPAVTDSMTVKTSVFASHLAYLKAHGYAVMPLRRLVEYLAGAGPAPPERSVAITVDDGHKSVFTDLFPLIVRERIPVTLFIYPSAISNASYALTWAQLREMRDSGLVDIESHTYWHPDFNVERRKLAAAAYERFVQEQLAGSKAGLERQLGGRVDMLAWPFGLYDRQLMRSAQQAGYVAAFALGNRPAGRTDDLLALPRYLMSNRIQGRLFASLLERARPGGGRESPAGAGRAPN